VPINDDFHLKLHERISSLSDERQTRWQKILNLVTGGAS
jgi:hypothetical protein